MSKFAQLLCLEESPVSAKEGLRLMSPGGILTAQGAWCGEDACLVGGRNDTDTKYAV